MKSVKQKFLLFGICSLLIWSPFNFVIAKIPNDPGVENLWYLNQIKAPRAWEITTGSSDIVIAVIDSGVAVNHPDLKQNIWKNLDEIPNDGIDNDNNGYVDDVVGWDFLEESNDPAPKYGVADKGNVIGISHGTIISGIIAGVGDNKTGISGISWNSKIMPLRVLDNKGLGRVSVISEAIDYAIENGADIINLSFFGKGRSGILDRAVRKAYEAGIVVVTPAGDQKGIVEQEGIDLDKEPGSPVCVGDLDFDRKISFGIAATDYEDKKTNSSNYGRVCVDLSAPGVGFFSTIINDPFIGTSSDYGGLFAGTSLSVPLVSGAAALLKSLDKSLSSGEIVEYLIRGADSILVKNPGFESSLGSGRLNIRNSMEILLRERDTERYLDLANRKEGSVRLVLSADSDYSSKVWVYELTDGFALLRNSIETYPFLFEEGVRTEISDQDNRVYVLPGRGGGPQLMILDENGRKVRQSFIDDKSGRGGKFLSLGIFNNREQIVLGSGKSENPTVTVLDKNTLRELEKFAVYPSGYRSGVRVITADINDDGQDEIITGTEKGGGPQLRIFKPNGDFINHFFVFDTKNRDGFTLAAGDINGDKKDEIIVANGEGEVTQIRIYSGKGQKIHEFFPFGENYKSGVNLALADINNDGIEEIIASSLGGINSEIRVFDSKGKFLYRFNPFAEGNYFGGLNINISN